MKNQKKIDMLLHDMYRIDPKLKQHEASLEKIIDELYLAKPNVQLNEEFRQQLHSKLLEKIEAQKISRTSIWSIMSVWKKLALSTSFLMILIIISGMIFFSYPRYKDNNQSVSKKESSLAMSDQKTIVQREEAAFGKLQVPSQNQQEPQNEQDFGVEIGNTPSRSAVDGSAEIIPRIPPAKRFLFIYNGEEVQINQSKSEVLRRIKNVPITSFEDLISIFEDRLIDFGSFSDSRLQSFSFIEDKPFGLTVHASAEDGSISITQNWQRWQNSSEGGIDFHDDLTLDSLPADQMIIAVADDFIQRHGIDMTYFEPGVVDHQWKNYISHNDELSSSYIPKNISVVYPLVIDERKIFNQSGVREGLRVQINISFMRVSGAYGITTQNYESSLYATETDFGKLVEIAKNGGSVYPTPLLEQNYEQANAVTLELDTPAFSYVKYWHYTGNETQELIAPALIFPINKAKDNGYYQENIVVPIIKDLLIQK